MRLIIVLILFVTIFSSTACAHYSKGPWKGKVIDSETKQPIEGAAVVAVWTEDYAAVIERHTAFVDAYETQTNADGIFEIPAKSFIPKLPDGKIEGPDFTIFKPGYGYFPRYYVYPRFEYPKTIKGYFEKPNAVVELPKLKSIQERKEKLPDIPYMIENKKLIKNYIHLLNIERREIGLDSFYEE